MKRLLTQSLAIGLSMTAGIAIMPVTNADEANREARYEITITNITRGQQFTPILAVAHTEAVRLFTLGQPASSKLATLAEEGNVAPLQTVLSTTSGVGAVVAGNGLTNPGGSVTLTLNASSKFDLLSVAAMLIPTNDAFFALNSVRLPRRVGEMTVSSPAYDSGSEVNDEKCASIPGPSFTECGGPGGGAAPSGGEEGYVHIHAGIHGVGDLSPANRDWRNPVATVTIRRVE